MKFGARWFRGVVTDHDVSTDHELIWHVVFDDGDECDLNLVELLPILLPETHLSPPLPPLPLPPLPAAFLSQKAPSPNHLSPIPTFLSRKSSSPNHLSPFATFPAVSCPPTALPLLSQPSDPLFPPTSSYPRLPPSSFPLNSPQANHLARSNFFPQKFFPSLPIGPKNFSSSSRPFSLFGVSLPSLSLAATSAGAPTPHQKLSSPQVFPHNIPWSSSLLPLSIPPLPNKFGVVAHPQVSPPPTPPYPPLSSFSLAAASAGAPLTYTRPPLPPPVPSHPTWFLPPSSSLPAVSSYGAPVLNLDPSGSPLTFRSALSGPHRLQWLLASDTELVKLVETTRTICPVHFAASPPTYFNPIPKEKWSPSSLSIHGPLRSLTSDVDRRVRGTAGGDRLDSSCPPSTHVASLPCVNLLLNSVVSTDAFFGSVDLTDFYLGTDLSSPQYIKLFTHLFSHSVLSHLNLLPFIKSPPDGKPYLLFRIDKTMYGLKEAGKLSQLRLISHLAAHGFFETTTPLPLPPCLSPHHLRLGGG